MLTLALTIHQAFGDWQEKHGHEAQDEAFERFQWQRFKEHWPKAFQNDKDWQLCRNLATTLFERGHTHRDDLIIFGFSTCAFLDPECRTFKVVGNLMAATEALKSTYHSLPAIWQIQSFAQQAWVVGRVFGSNLQ